MRDPGEASARVMMWRMDSRDASMTIWFGALEDGTVFQQIGRLSWETVLVGPRDVDDSFRCLIEWTRRAEDHMRMTGPAEFAVDRVAAGNIRGDVNWNDTELSLMIGFDMVLRSRR